MDAISTFLHLRRQILPRNMERLLSKELLDCTDVPDHVIETAYRDLVRIHSWLGDTECVIRALGGNRVPLGRVLDIGCATGGTAARIRKTLNIDVVGVDLRGLPGPDKTVPIIIADATRDRLPVADAAFAMHLVHHLSEKEVIQLIRNVGRSCRRFIILDLVRHWLPLALFRTFIAPFVCRVTAMDGATSVRRAYSSVELRAIVECAIDGSGATFSHKVAPFYVRQVFDIEFH
jgi:SAM-dependent methyltransferase